jgi:hypothetical protein
MNEPGVNTVEVPYSVVMAGCKVHGSLTADDAVSRYGGKDDTLARFAEPRIGNCRRSARVEERYAFALGHRARSSRTRVGYEMTSTL